MIVLSAMPPRFAYQKILEENKKIILDMKEKNKNFRRKNDFRVNILYKRGLYE